MNLQPAETTLYSLSDAAPGPPDERRHGDRLTTLYRVGSLVIAGSRELCLIRNISAGGMMVRAFCPVPEAARLSVELKCGQSISGTVSWVRDIHVGIRFDHPIDVIDILSTSAEGRDRDCRESRSTARSRCARARRPIACAAATSVRAE